MKNSISLKYIKISNSCINLSTKYIISSDKSTGKQNHQKIKNLLMKKKSAISLNSLEKLVHLNFVNTYSNDKNFYNIKVMKAHML